MLRSKIRVRLLVKFDYNENDLITFEAILKEKKSNFEE